MALSVGRRIGPYEILDKLGEGGMGEVYRARDTRLHRDVAIKVLPELFAKDPDRLERFEREAQVLASLNHAHIAQIHGIEESGGIRALVMELVEGETLADRLARGPVPLDEAIPITRQIAEALEAAHDRGIIHRDLKPANIKVRRDGTVKVLDFGLAKALESGPISGVDAMNSPTLTVRGATAAGVILGTAAYMSPEQARGNVADARSDIWAFGVVLYEMLTGKPLFEGTTVSDILAAVLRDGPDWDALPRDTSASVRRLLRRALEKDPQLRLRHAGDARLELLDSGRDQPAAPPLGKRKHVLKNIVIPVAAALAGAVLTPFVASYFKVPPAPPLRKWTIEKESANDVWGRENVPAISPDGTRVAYADGDRIRIRALDALDPIEVPGTGRAGMPTWSPDSRFVVYFVDHRALWKVPAEGGNPQKVCDLPPGLVFGLAWRPDRSIVINMVYGPAAGEFFSVSEHGGRPEKLPALHRDGAAVFFLRGSAGGTLVYSRLKDGKQETIVEQPDKSPQVLDLRHTGAVLTANHLIYAGAATPGIWAVSFDRSKGTVGTPFRIAADGIGPSVSLGGTLAYGRSVRGSRQLWWVNRDGTLGAPIGLPQDDMEHPAISPDGTQIAVAGTENGESSIWLHEAGRAAKNRVTTPGGGEPSWHPQGDSLLYSRFWNIFSLRLDGRSEPQRMRGTDVPEYTASWSRDGRYMIYGQFEQKTQADIWILESGAKEPKPFLSGPAQEVDPALSPDGRLLAYASDETGRMEIFVRTFPEGSNPRQVSFGGGLGPTWNSASNEVFYVESHTLMAAPVNAGSSIQIGAPRPLFPLEQRAKVLPVYDTRDGKRFVVVRTLEEPVNAVAIVQSWFSEFRHKQR